MQRKYVFLAFSMLLLLLSACIEKAAKTTPEEKPVIQRPPVSSSSPQATLHAVIVADTNDQSIGKSVDIDRKNLEELLPSIAKNTGLTLKAQSIYGHRLTRNTVATALNQLPVKPNDLVIFYYSGHGGRMSNKRTKWPSMVIEKSLLDFDKIIAALKRKNPRFFIAIADSCNNVLDKYSPTRDYFLGRPKQESYRQLFLNYRGNIVVSSSKPGQYSWGTSQYGGLFTRTFLGSLKRELASSNPKWQNIMQRAEKPIKVRQYVQEPQYEINIERVGRTTVPAQPVSPAYKEPLSVQVLSNQPLRVGDAMRIKVRSPQAGYLFVWDIGSGGEITRLFPNQYVKRRKFKAGKTLTIPENSLAGFGLTVGEPLGKSMVVALLVEEQKVQKLQPEKLESIVATNAQTGWQRLRKRLNQMLEQGRWLTATVNYEITQ
jgi:hypothetical protein